MDETPVPVAAICDAHHHLWDGSQPRYSPAYLPGDLRRNLTAAPAVGSVVYVECRSAYRTGGEPRFAPVGETEWVHGLITAGEPILGIVGFADLSLGEEVDAVLDAHLAAGAGRFSGVRNTASWSADPAIPNSPHTRGPGLLRAPAFRRGLAALCRRSLVFETWIYSGQLTDVAELAAEFPDLVIVLDHLGGPAYTGGDVRGRERMLARWRTSMTRLARRGNVVIKLGGIGMRRLTDAASIPEGPRPEALARLWQREFDFCVDTFGAGRCMFESNYPADSALAGYADIWEAFRLMTSERSDAERRALFHGTAVRVYTPAG